MSSAKDRQNATRMGHGVDLGTEVGGEVIDGSVKTVTKISIKLIVMLRKWHIVIVLFIGLSFLFIQVINRNKLLSEKGEVGVAHLYRIEKNVSTAKVSSRDIAYLEYFISGERIRFTKQVLNDKILVGKCYEIIYVKQSPTIVEVYFGKIRNCPAEPRSSEK